MMLYFERCAVYLLLWTLCCTFQLPVCVVHSILNTFCTLRYTYNPSKLYTKLYRTHCTPLHSLRCASYTPHSLPPTLYSMLYLHVTPLSTLYITYSTLFLSLQTVLYAVHYTPFHPSHWALHITHFFYSIFCVVYITFYTL